MVKSLEFPLHTLYSFGFWVVLGIKVVGLALLTPDGLLGGGDANYYDDYALGYRNDAVNFWPVILRFFHDSGMYSREGWAVIVQLTSFFIIPFLLGAICRGNSRGAAGKLMFWRATFVVSLYPTLYYYSLDIYRDVIMVCLFLFGVFLVQAHIEKNAISRRLVFASYVVLACIAMASFRMYLGVAFFLSFITFRFFSFKKTPLLVTLVGYVFLLSFFNALGFLDPIAAYREVFQEMEGGSNIGLAFSSDLLFPVEFTKSFLCQMLGFYFPNKSAVFVFFVESIPFLIGLLYIIKNRCFSSKIVDFLVVFSLVYGLVWLIGNDNLGTAVRLRMFNYISVVIIAASIYFNKSFWIDAKSHSL